MRNLILAASLVLLAAPAAAQHIDAKAGATAGGKPEVRVQVNMSFFVQAPTNDSEAGIQAQERARKALYDSSGRECDVLRATIASECRLDSINVNMNRQYGSQQPEGFTANGNFGYRVILK